MDKQTWVKLLSSDHLYALHYAVSIVLTLNNYYADSVGQDLRSLKSALEQEKLIRWGVEKDG